MEGPQHLIEPFWFHFLNPRVGLIGDAEAQQVGMPQVGELLDRLELAIDHFGLERLHSAMAGPAAGLLQSVWPAGPHYQDQPTER